MTNEDEEKDKKEKPVSQADRLIFLALKGALVATVFLFTPLLSMVLNTLGLGSLAPLLNGLMFPLLFICFSVMGYGMWQKKRQDKSDPDK